MMLEHKQALTDAIAMLDRQLSNHHRRLHEIPEAEKYAREMRLCMDPLSDIAQKAHFANTDESLGHEIERVVGVITLLSQEILPYAPTNFSGMSKYMPQAEAALLGVELMHILSEAKCMLVNISPDPDISFHNDVMNNPAYYGHMLNRILDFAATRLECDRNRDIINDLRRMGKTIQAGPRFSTGADMTELHTLVEEFVDDKLAELLIYMRTKGEKLVAVRDTEDNQQALQNDLATISLAMEHMANALERIGCSLDQYRSLQQPRRRAL